MPALDTKAELTNHDPDADYIYVLTGGGLDRKMLLENVLKPVYTQPWKSGTNFVWWDSTNSVWRYDTTAPAAETDGTAVSGGLANVVEDTTPQLGGNLDVNGNKITSASNGDIDIEPNGTGNVLLGNFVFDADQAITASEDNYVLKYDHSTGLISLELDAGGGGGASQLTDLSDVSAATPTDKHALMGNGSDFASRALVEADISDLQSYLLPSDIGSSVQAQDALLQTIADAVDFDAAGLVAKTGAQTIAGEKTVTDVFKMQVATNSKNMVLENLNATGRIGLDFLYSGGGSNDDDYFRFQFRPDLGDVLQTVYDSSAGSFVTFLTFDYLTKAARIGTNATYSLGVGKAPTEALDVNGGILASDNIKSLTIIECGVYTVSTVPTATAGGIIYVSDETGGAVLAFSDGTDWRRVTDRAVVS